MGYGFQGQGQTICYDLTPEEKALYDEVTSYVRSKRKEAKAKKNRNLELTLVVMQRRLAGSLYAITRTLENRLRALNEVLSVAQALFDVLPRDLEDWKLIHAILGERQTLRAEGKRTAYRDTQGGLFDGRG